MDTEQNIQNNYITDDLMLAELTVLKSACGISLQSQYAQ